MASIYEKLGEKVLRLRKERGLTQEQLAEMIKSDPRTIVAIEAGKRNPTLKTINKLASSLKISLRELLDS